MFWNFKLSLIIVDITSFFWPSCPKIGLNFNQFSGHTDDETLIEY
jgi:hypothetical protein